MKRCDGLSYPGTRRIENVGGLRDEVVHGHIDVPVRLAEPVQHINRPGLQAAGRVRRDPEFLGDPVRRPEADAVDVGGQAVGVFAKDMGGRRSVGAENFLGQIEGHIVFLEEEYHLLDLALAFPAFHHSGEFLLAQPGNRQKASRFVFDDVEGISAEARDNPLGQSGPDIFQGAGGEEFLDPLDRGRNDGLGEDGMELSSEAGVFLPFPLELGTLALLDAGQVADHGDGRKIAVRLNDQHGIARVFGPEANAVHRAGEHSPGVGKQTALG